VLWQRNIIREFLLDRDLRPARRGLVSVVSPWGSILIRLTQNFCIRLLTAN